MSAQACWLRHARASTRASSHNAAGPHATIASVSTVLGTRWPADAARPCGRPLHRVSLIQGERLARLATELFDDRSDSVRLGWGGEASSTFAVSPDASTGTRLSTWPLTFPGRGACVQCKSIKICGAVRPLWRCCRATTSSCRCGSMSSKRPAVNPTSLVRMVHCGLTGRMSNSLSSRMVQISLHVFQFECSAAWSRNCIQ